MNAPRGALTKIVVVSVLPSATASGFCGAMIVSPSGSATDSV